MKFILIKLVNNIVNSKYSISYELLFLAYLSI